MTAGATIQARATTDGEDRLVAAEEPLAGLQLRCGGELPGVIAIPALLEAVSKARRYGLKLARHITAHDGQEAISAWVDIEPGEGSEQGCTLTLGNWHSTPVLPEDLGEMARRRADIDRLVAELAARLDADQRVLTVDCEAADLASVAAAMRASPGRPWTDFVTIEGSSHRQPMHWRLLDGAVVRVEGSARRWRASLLPHEMQGGQPGGFELCLASDTPLTTGVPSMPSVGAAPAGASGLGKGVVSRDIAPVLRQPISRIIANAETIRTRLAGPLAEEYSAYAGDIAAAGQHLLALIDDLADLEVVESDTFTTAPDRIDLADVARRAAGILGVRARERGISIDAPRMDESVPVVAEFRRVLQILLNLLSNAIRYAPANSQIWIRLEDGMGGASVVVADQGPGMDADQQARVFDKFERLGRSGDGGSGLGLYISRRLARAMGGDLTVDSALGQGARFRLDLPANTAAH